MILPFLLEDGRLLEIRIGPDRWRFKSVPTSSYEDRVSISKNGRYVRSPSVPTDTWFPGFAYYRFTLPRIATPFPIVAIRGHTGAGSGQETRFYRFDKGTLRLMGKAPYSYSNGPVLWRGKQDHWLFDNTDIYDMRQDGEAWIRRYHLYRIGKNGRLQFVRSWRAPQSRPLRDTIRLRW